MTRTPTARRAGLASFLRSRRERIRPEDVGITPGPRRRTPGLRREEVAQLSGVGVTWYTWLEQGRPINSSAHVLSAVARTLRLDEAERDHLFRLAEVPQTQAGAVPATGSSPELDEILHAVDPLPAVLVNDRTDLLGWNRAYGVLHPDLIAAAPEQRNIIWNLFTVPPERSHISNRDEQAPEVVATFRYRHGQHRNDPQWVDLVARLCATSALFARLWDTQNVAPPSLCDKCYDIPGIGELRLSQTGLDLTGHPGLRLVIHTPSDGESRTRIDEALRRSGSPITPR